METLPPLLVRPEKESKAKKMRLDVLMPWVPEKLSYDQTMRGKTPQYCKDVFQQEAWEYQNGVQLDVPNSLVYSKVEKVIKTLRRSNAVIPDVMYIKG